MDKKILLLILIISFFVIFYYNTRELFVNKCISDNKFNIIDNVKCNIDSDEMNRVNKKGNIQHCSNKYPNKIDNYKLSIKCDPPPKCACGDNLKCIYVNENGKTILKRVCKVPELLENKILNNSNILNNNIIKTIPTLCSNPNFQSGYYYDTDENSVEQVKNIYINQLGESNKCSGLDLVNKCKSQVIQEEVYTPTPPIVSIPQEEHIIQPEVVQPEVVQPEVVQPEVVQPEVVQPKIQKNITIPLKSGEKLKPGNNGTINGTTFCRGSWQGWSANNCVRMQNNDTSEYLDCNTVPHSKTKKLGNYTATCADVIPDQLIKPGNNGTVNGNTFCHGQQWHGWSKPRCINMTAECAGKIVDCNKVPGIKTAGGNSKGLCNWSAVCEGPINKLKPGQKIKGGNNGSVNGNTFCKGNWGGWSAKKCVRMMNHSTGEYIDCNIIPAQTKGLGNYSATCEDVYPNKQILKPGNNGTVNGNTFCRGKQWHGWATTNCLNNTAPGAGRVIDCNTTPGLNSGGASGWVATCSNNILPGQKIKGGNNGSVSGNTFCRGRQWGGWSKPNCVTMKNNNTGEYVDCNSVPALKLGLGNYSAVCV